MKIVTSLSFQGQCREAFEFYAKVLGGKITAAMPYCDAPPGMPISDEKYKSWLMHCWLEVGDQALMGADMDVSGRRTSTSPRTASTSRCTPRTRPRPSAGSTGSPKAASVMPFGETFWSPATARSSTGSACRG